MFCSLVYFSPHLKFANKSRNFVFVTQVFLFQSSPRSLVTLQNVYILSFVKWIIHWHQIMHSFLRKKEGCFLSIILDEWKDLLRQNTENFEFNRTLYIELKHSKARRSEENCLRNSYKHSEWLKSRSFIDWRFANKTFRWINHKMITKN